MRLNGINIVTQYNQSLTISSIGDSGQNLIIFDGVCKLCAGTVRFVVRNETDRVFRFTPLQTATGARLMREHGIDPDDADTFVVLADGRAYIKSDAAFRLLRHLRSRWKVLHALRIFPRPLRDWVYDVVARNRYQWFGKYEECIVPTPELKDRFIDD